MADGKQNTAGQALRRQKIIDYIKQNGPVKSGAICAALSLSRSSLSDDIRAINAHGAILTSPRRGCYIYTGEADRILAEGAMRGKLDRTHIRRWYILAILSASPCTFEELLEKLRAASFTCSAATLHTDLKDLRNDTYIRAAAENGHVYYRSARILSADRREITQYHARHKSNSSRSQILQNTYASIDRKLAHSLPEQDVKTKTVSIHRIGKQSTISEDQLELLQAFREYPFSDRVLMIPYRTNNGRLIRCSFSTGLLLYSAETNRIYLLGRNDKKENTIIPLDRVQTDAITIQTDSYNYLYQSPEFLRMYDEMFHLSTEEPAAVRVRFTNLPFIYAKIRRLCEVRTHASMKLTADGTELLYTDTLRGLSDFARYLRRFGRSALVDEPAELRTMMMETSRKVMELYDDDL